MDNNNTEERRDSFRVEMTAFVSIEPVDSDCIDASTCFPELHSMALLSESTNIDSEIALLTERVKDIAVKKSLELLQNKINLMTKMIDIQATQSSQLDSQTVNVSEGGCSLVTEKAIENGQRVAVALVFTPSYYAHFAFATVADQHEESGKTWLHLTFESLSETQKQHLLKHMFKAQTSHAH